MNQLITLILVFLIFPVVNASAYNEMMVKGQELGSLYQIDKYLWETNNYTNFKKLRSLTDYWNDKLGDCTEIARAKQVMYKGLGYKTRIVHGYDYNNNTRYKHDYVEYRNETAWTSTEYRYSNYTLKKVGWGIWWG